MKAVFLTIDGVYVNLHEIVSVSTQNDYTVVTLTTGVVYTKDSLETVKAAIDAAIAQANV